MPLLKPEPEIWPAALFGTLEGEVPAPSATLPDPIETVGGALAGEATDGPRWWVAYTRSRQEKHLARYLLQSAVAYYLPQRQHKVRAGDRWRLSYLPLFTGYVFFRGDLGARRAALRSNLIVHLIEPLHQEDLATELRSLWLLQLTGEPLLPYPYIAAGDEVEVTAGALKGYRGLVLREKGKYRLVVSITLLRQSVSIELERETLAPAALRKVS